MQSVASLQASRPAVAVRPARANVTRVMAQSRPEAPKQQKAAALAAVAAFAAAVLVNAAPVQAADVKTVVCASNTTAKLCLKNSAKK